MIYFSIIRFREGGITQLLFKKLINQEEKAICDEQNRVIVTEIDSFYGVLMTIATTFIIGLIILVFEIIVHKHFYDKTTGQYDFKGVFGKYFGFKMKRHQLSK